jgi:hypothetical protein
MSSSWVFDNVFERGQCEVPKALEVRAQLGDSRRVNLIEASSSLGPVHHESDVFEHLEMLGHRRPRHRQVACEFSNSKRLFSEQLEDGKPSWVGQDAKGRAFVSLHLP